MQRGHGGRAARRRWHSKPCGSQPSRFTVCVCVCENLTVCVCVCACVCFCLCQGACVRFTVACSSHRMGDQDIPHQCIFTDIILAHLRKTENEVGAKGKSVPGGEKKQII